MSHLGRLPPLQAIGRSHCVDMEEPPDLSDTEIDQFLDAYNNKETVYKFDQNHANHAVADLGTHFRILHPGDLVCKKIPEGATGFTHSKNALTFAVKYAELRHMMQTQARLQFIRDYVTRLNAASLFVKDLEEVVRQEHDTWYNICHSALTSAPTTKLLCLSAICEDLRVHMNHWNSIKQLLHTDHWLRSLVPTLLLDVDQVRVQLFRLRDCAMWWVDRLIQIGFRVLAHSDLERISQDELWSIMRGLEDFNSIVSGFRLERMVEPHGACGKSTREDACVVFNSYRNIRDTLKPIAFTRVLSLLASERSLYAAASTHQFFTTCRELLHIAVSRKGLSGYRWGLDVVGGKSHIKGRKPCDTSDYHTESGSHISLGTAMLRVGDIMAPDLSQEISPLMDFARREKTFAQKFLQIVCHSTKLLKHPQGNPTIANGSLKRKGKPPLGTSSINNTPNLPKKSGLKHTKKDYVGNIKKNDSTSKKQPEISENPPESSSSSLSLVRSDPTRKSVSWSDAGEVAMIQQLTQRYTDLLWQAFSIGLMEQLSQPVWGGSAGVRGQLGSVLLCSDLVVQILIRMIQQTCAKDIFPQGATISLSQVSERLHVMSAWRAWDNAMCSGLASSAVDKCHPVMLVEGEHSSNTARCLRDAFQPLHSALHNLQITESGDASSRRTSLLLRLRTLQRLQTTCTISMRWCSQRGHLYLSGWALGAFLLVTQSDYKILGDEFRRGLANSQGILSDEDVTDCSHSNELASIETGYKQQILELKLSLELQSGQLQVLSGTLVKHFSEKCHQQAVEYFDDEMPVGKIWKRRQPLEGKVEPSPYVEHALDTLLEPVIAGANKLGNMSQLSVVSMATTAMCEAWTDVILQRKIKFSVIGAEQLEQDFGLVETWLQMYLHQQQVRQSILSLDVFKYLRAIVDILKRQPKGRSLSRPPESRRLIGSDQEPSSTGSMCCDVSTQGSNQWQENSSSNTAGLSSSGDSDTEHQLANHNTEHNHTNVAEDDNEKYENYKMPKMEQWLALRVHGGARNWPKLPSCFNNTHS